MACSVRLVPSPPQNFARGDLDFASTIQLAVIDLSLGPISQGIIIGPFTHMRQPQTPCWTIDAHK